MSLVDFVSVRFAARKLARRAPGLGGTCPIATSNIYKSDTDLKLILYFDVTKRCDLKRPVAPSLAAAPNTTRSLPAAFA